MFKRSWNTKLLIAALLVIGILIFLIVTIIPQKNTKSIPPIPIFNRPSPTPSARLIKPYDQLKTLIGITKEEQLPNFSNFKNKTTLPDNKVQYNYESLLPSRNDIVITDNGVAVFERLVTVTSNYEHPRLSHFRSKYGEAEREIAGSTHYGALEKVYIYASRGFALVANPFTEEVDEIHYFLPTAIDKYISAWGQDIKENQTTEEKLGT